MDTNIAAIGNVALSGIGMIKRLIDLGGPITGLIPYASTVSSAIGLLQTGIELGKDIIPNAEKFINTFSKPTVSLDDMAALDADIAAERATLHAPLPPKEDGEPD